jgi:hypothetical protein
MTRLVINNSAQNEWSAVIEHRVQLVLGSILPHFRRLELELRHRPGQDGSCGTYVCTLAAVLKSGQRQTVLNQHPDANHAIQGTIARAEREAKRALRARKSQLL